MKTYEDYEKEYNKKMLEVIAKNLIYEKMSKENLKSEYIIKKEIWIGFQLCEDENKIPNGSEDFIICKSAFLKRGSGGTPAKG